MSKSRTTTATRRLMSVMATLLALGIGAGSARAANATKSDQFQLTRGDFTELAFVPGAAGPINANAQWSGTGVVRKDIALRMQIVRPDGSIAKEAVGGSPLPLSFNLSAAEFAQNKGRAYKIVLRHNVAGQDSEKVKGTLAVSFPIATVVVLDNSARPIDLGGKGSKTEVSFSLPNKPGKLEIDISFRDGLFNGKDLVAQLVRGDGVVVASTTGDSGLKLSRNVSAADLAKGLTWKVRLTNNGNTTVKGIKIVGRFTPN